MKQKILYVEDETNLGKIVSEALEGRGFEVALVKDGIRALEKLAAFRPDVCVLDVMLPNMDGFELGKKIRDRFSRIPIVFLTAKSQTADVIKGFSSGGTDYIRKPFSMEELIVRINNQLQLVIDSQAWQQQDEILLGSSRFLPSRFELYTSKKIYKLSNREAEVLRLLSSHINKPIDRKMILMEIWGDDSFFHSRNLDVYIRKLREYFATESGIEIITLKGKGYQFVVSNVT